MTFESPKIWILSIAQREAKVRVAHKPGSSALVFVPTPQFRYHFVTLEACDLKIPPAEQQFPVGKTAPSKQASVKPSKSVISQTLFGMGFTVRGCQVKETAIYMFVS